MYVINIDILSSTLIFIIVIYFSKLVAETTFLSVTTASESCVHNFILALY